MMRILHGEQGFTYHAPAYVGDRLTITTTTEDIYAKKGGALEFVVQTTRFEKDDGTLCAEARQPAVVRNGCGADQRRGGRHRSEERRVGTECVRTCRSHRSLHL